MKMNKKFKSMMLVFIIIGIVLICLNIVGAADRIIRISSGWPAWIDPGVGSDNTACRIIINLYDSLVARNRETGEPTPSLAKSWEVNENGLSWTFYLNEGIKFHDGTELTAEDVKFSMDRLLTLGEGFAYLFLNRVSSTEVVNRYTVTFHLEKQVGPFLSMLGRLYILNKDLVLEKIETLGSYGDMGDYGKGWLLNHDAGSGPYMLKEILPQEAATLVINSHYWQSISPFAPDECIIYNNTESVTVKSMLANNEIDIGYHGYSKETLNSMDRLEGVDIKHSTQNGQMYLMLNNKIPPTDDVHIRKAIAWGIDYKTIIEDIWPGATYARGPIPKLTPGYDPTVTDYTFDLEKAKEELEKSIYYNELDKYPISFYWLDRIPDEEKIILLAMCNLDQIGIQINSVKVPNTKLMEDLSALETSPNGATLYVNGDFLEAGSLLDVRYKSASAPTYAQNEWLLSPELDARIDDALATVDKEQRFAKYSEITKYLHDDLCVSVSLFDNVLNFPYRSSYVEWPDLGYAALMGDEFYLPNFKILK